MNIDLTKTYKLFTDGGSRGNPGKSACAWVIYDQDNNQITSGSKYLGITTNNDAEYQGLIEGLNIAVTLGIKKLECFSDSELMVKQMKGIYKIKDQNLYAKSLLIKEKQLNFGEINYHHVLRQYNKFADKLVNDCVDSN